jgi:AraC-like DNA-binding protein
MTLWEMPSEDGERLCRQTVDGQLDRVAAGRGGLRVPRPEGLMNPARGHFHFTPEVFLQIEGHSEFRCPKETFLLKAGEIGVLPVGLPHREAPRPRQGPWMNMVVMLSPTTVSWHLAGLRKPGEICGVPDRTVQTTAALRLIAYLTDLVEVSHSKSAARRPAANGLLLAFLARLRDIMDGDVPSPRSKESCKVLQCRHHVQKNLADPQLNVQFLARCLQCSSDYLSHVFRKEAGLPLIGFIQQQRVSQARGLLESTSMSIKEVAQAVGYEDPGYFIRVFKRIAGQTPRVYRDRSR